jgi:TRAP-type C4-dicarboxylate transport system substrate-binding protein
VTNHIWSGFNELAHLPTWKRLPVDIQTIIERNVARHVRLQRLRQATLNARLRTALGRQGATFNAVEQAPFRRLLGGVYEKWKKQLGSRCWSLLEEGVGGVRL